MTTPSTAGPLEPGEGPAVEITVEVREVPADSDGYSRSHRVEFQRSLELLREEFGTRLGVDYYGLAEASAPFRPVVRVNNEELCACSFPPENVLRLVIARHLAVSQVADCLLEEAEREAHAADHPGGCWQDGLLPRDP